MNKTLENLARDSIKQMLSECTEKQQQMFKRMYSPGKPDLPINTVVDRMADDKLSWAMTQLENTLKRNVP